MACISGIFGIIFTRFTLSTNAKYLEDEVNINQEYIGFIFGVFPGSFFISALIVGIISKKIPRIYLAQVAFFLISISLILQGPSKLLDLPKNLGIILTGFVFLGMSYAIIVVPIIAEIIDAVKEKEQVKNEDQVTIGKISDLASGLFGSFNALANFSAPIIGGILS